MSNGLERQRIPSEAERLKEETGMDFNEASILFDKLKLKNPGISEDEAMKLVTDHFKPMDATAFVEELKLYRKSQRRESLMRSHPFQRTKPQEPKKEIPGYSGPSGHWYENL